MLEAHRRNGRQEGLPDSESKLDVVVIVTKHDGRRRIDPKLPHEMSRSISLQAEWRLRARVTCAISMKAPKGLEDSSVGKALINFRGVPGMDFAPRGKIRSRPHSCVSTTDSRAPFQSSLASRQRSPD